MQQSQPTRFALLLQELQEEHESEVARACLKHEQTPQTPSCQRHQRLLATPACQPKELVDTEFDVSCQLAYTAGAINGNDEVEVTNCLELPEERPSTMSATRASIGSSEDGSRSCTFTKEKHQSMLSGSSRSLSFSRKGTFHWSTYKIRTHWFELPDTGAMGIGLNDNEPVVKQMSKRPSGNAGRLSKMEHFKLHKQLPHLLHRSLEVMDPASRKRTAWDVFSGILIFYDVWSIPMLVFEQEEDNFTMTMAWFCLIFWTLDMVLSILTGYYQNGKLVMDRRKIMKNYLRGWFPIDCLAIVPDWILRILQSESSLGRLGRLLRVARGMRVLRLLRFLKLSRVLSVIYDAINSEYMFIIVGLVRLLVLILVLNHLVACCWYFIGRLGLGGRNWIQNSGKFPAYEGDLAWRYTTSMHWSITQFTPAAMDISATNTGERIYSVFIIFWGLLGLSSFVGSVTSSITALRNMSSDSVKQVWLLRKYMRQRRVSSSLVLRILRYVEYRELANKDVLVASQVPLLSNLSEHLTAQLMKETNAYIMDNHSFFQVLNSNLEIFMDHVCHRALHTVEYAQDDVAFSEAHESSCMMFVKSGTFFYSKTFTDLTETAFIGEAALWTIWWHRGNLIAKGNVNEVVQVMQDAFGAALCEHPKPWYLAHSYATEFVGCINAIDHADLSDIVNTDTIDVRDILQNYSEFEMPDNFSSKSSLETTPPTDLNSF